MNAAWVIDSSIGFSWVQASQATPATEGLLDLVRAGTTIFVPHLWFTEMANGLLVLQRRKKISAAERRSALVSLENLAPIVDQQPGHAVFSDISDLAEKHGLTAYDATYLELALRRKLALATRDQELRKAAIDCGVQVL